MRDYVIINGVNSLTINGLAISKLPPISKPLMRNMKEEIDGRDGDIITELGYSAYDKTMEIGLYGNFDINEVISFFNGEGTITFSNEDDKHYYFKILDQIDYEKLLKFKTATITFHCQPFKYPNNEQIIDVDSLTVEGTGTDITLANTSLYTPINTELLGDTYQYTTTGRNLFVNSENLVAAIDGQAQMQKTGSGRECTLTKTSTGTASPRIQFANDFFEVNTTYYFSFKVKGNWNVVDFGTWFNNVQQNIVSITPTSSYQLVSGSFTYPSTKYTSDRLFWANTDGRIAVGQSITITDFMISKSSNTEYEPYTNGASPNPDYPQAIETVTGRQEIDVVGKNLLPINIASGTTLNGLTITKNDDGYYVLNGTTTANTTLNLYSGENITIPAGTYTGSFTDRTNIVDGYIRLNSGAYQTIFTSSSYKNTFTINSSFTFNRFYIFITNGKTFNNQIIKPILEVGDTATTYEEYKNNTYEINLGKNLFDKNNTNSINAYINGSTRKFSSSATVKTYFINCDPDTTYTISKIASNQFRVGTSSNVPIVDGTILQSWQDNNATTYTITTDINAKYLCICIFNSSGASITEQEVLDSVQIEKGSQATSYALYKAPIELCKIGNYQDLIKKGTGKNLFGFNITAFDKTTTYRVNVNQRLAIEGTSNPNECKFTFGSGSYCRGYFEIEGINGLLPYSISFNVKENTTSFTPLYTIETSSCNENRLVFYINGGNGSTLASTSDYFILTNIQVELGNQSTTFEPYGTNGKWLLHKEIGKIVLDGSEDEWSITGTNPFYRYRYLDYALYLAEGNNVISNQFSYNFINATNENIGISISSTLELRIRETTMKTIADWKTWLSNHPLEAYYVLAIPTTTEITDTELLALLNLLSNATTYDKATNIFSKGDLPSILKVSATFVPQTTITNIGNIYAKPLLTIKGSGDISVYLNGIQLLQIALGDREEITIDVSKMEAYDEETNVLLNRLVIGDYSKFLINSGVNELLITGDVSNFTMSNYTRWL